MIIIIIGASLVGLIIVAGLVLAYLDSLKIK